MESFLIKLLVCFSLILIAEQSSVQSQPNSNASPTPPSSNTDAVTTQPPPPVTTTDTHTTVTPPSHLSTLTPEAACGQHNGSCEKCLDEPGAKCLYCKSNDECVPYPYKKVLPPSSLCALDKARWGVCWLNFEALIIGVSTVGGIIILTITCCCVYCCCCRGKNNKKYQREDDRFNAQKMERKAKNDERRTERKERLDEIRRKYGLMKDEPYQRFEA